MTVTMCDKCKQEIKKDETAFYMQLEEWPSSEYVTVPTMQKRYQLCLDCYRKELNEVY